MIETEELNEYLNAQAALRDHLAQFEVPKEEAKKIISWYLITQDIDEMVGCVNCAAAIAKIQPMNLLIITALWEKMIIGYGKIFGKSEDGFSTLPIKLIDKTDMPLHNELIKIRHSYLAHRGENQLEHHKLILSVEGTEDICHIQFIVPGIRLKGQYGIQLSSGNI
jgi:hypothetical protein